MRSLRRLRTNEQGFTVIEGVIASTLTLVLAMAVLSLMDSGAKSERISQARHSAQLTLRGATMQMTKEIRQAVSVAAGSTQTVLDMQTLLYDQVTNSVQTHRVVYRVTGSPPDAKLERLEDPTGTAPGPYSGATAVQLADRVVAPQAFCYQYDGSTNTCTSTSPTATLSSIRISLEITPVAFNAGAVKLATDVKLRNVSA